MSYCLYRFSGTPEIVVISDLPEKEVVDEYGDEVEEILEIDGDAGGFPCDRSLIHRAIGG